MSEIRERILRMLADGAITPEQAEQLLDALEAGGAEPVRTRVEHGEPGEAPEAFSPASRVAEGLADLSPRLAERFADLGPRIAERVASATRGAERLAPLPPLPPRPPRPPRPARAPRSEHLFKVRRHKHRGGERFERLVELASLGISPATVKEYREVAPDLTTDQVMELALIGVSADTVAGMRRAAGVISVEEIIELATVGVSADYVEAARQAIGADVPAEKILELWVVGVSAEQLAEWQEIDAAEGEASDDDDEGFPGAGEPIADDRGNTSEAHTENNE